MHEMIERFATTAAAENRMDALIESHARLVEAIGRHDANEAALIVSDMMIVLRIESGRSWPRTANRVKAHQGSEIGMLDNRPHEKGDRP
ncbi:MAG: hypothetical protein E4H03_11765 [Myxococcales bacterium]|nr:MAG: hypothetical protein E4H03_11765 [Myxococcales bacterium]